MIKTIIFDLDGVLWNLDFTKLGKLISNDLNVDKELEEDFIKELKSMIKNLLHKKDLYITKNVIINTLEEEIALKKYQISVESLYQSLTNINYNYCINNEESLSVIKELKEKGYHLVVKTNWFQRVQIENLKRYHYDSYFDKVIGLENSYLKPNPLSIKEIVENNPINEYIIVGDSLEKEIALGNILGMKSIWLNEKRLDNLSKELTPTYEIHDIKELLNIL